MRVLFISLITTLLTLSAYSSTIGTSDEPTILEVKDHTSVDPRLPFSTYIQYNYSQGVITFSLPPEINYATVSIGADESSETWSGSITRDNPTAQIPALSGLYVITLTADNGAVYFGDIMLE